MSGVRFWLWAACALAGAAVAVPVAVWLLLAGPGDHLSVLPVVASVAGATLAVVGAVGARRAENRDRALLRECHRRQGRPQ